VIGRGSPLEIVSAGLHTVLGSGCLAAAMMARAARFGARPIGVLDKRGEVVRMGVVDDLPPDLYGLERIVALAVPALVEAAEGAAAALGHRGPLPVWLALPEAWRHGDPRPAGEVIDLLARASGVRIDRGRSGVIRAGRAGGAEAVERAAALWGAPDAPAAVLVGGADSAYHPSIIADLARWREESEPAPALRSEGAAFVALAPREGPRAAPREAARPDAPRLEGPPVLVTGAASWHPDLRAARPEEEEILLAEIDFVTARVELLKRALGAARAGWALPDVNDDPDRATEWWQIARDAGLEGAAEDHLAERIGDVGAAIGPAILATAWAWWKAGCGRAPAAVIALASDDGGCGAIALEAAAAP
jgi:3-oxoacyl-[acyl-carrier-protein] synthase-1